MPSAPIRWKRQRAGELRIGRPQGDRVWQYRLTSRTWMADRAGAPAAPSARCSGPTSSARARRSCRRVHLRRGPVRRSGSRPGAATESAIPAVLRAWNTELVGQAHRHLVQKGRERRAIRLVRAQRLRLPCQRGQQILGPAPISSLSRWCCSNICCRSSRCAFEVCSSSAVVRRSWDFELSFRSRARLSCASTRS